MGKPILRTLLGAPRILYRCRLGWLLGHRFLLLTHRGRQSGRLFQTIVEVVRHDKETRESIVVAGWGEKTDWYQNLQANGAVEIDIAGKRYEPLTRFLEPTEVYRELQAYLLRNGWARTVTTRLYGLRLDGTDIDRAGDLRGVAFESAQRIRSPVEPDCLPAMG